MSADDLNFEERIGDHDDEEDLDMPGRQVSLFIDTNTNYDEDEEYEDSMSKVPIFSKEDYSARQLIEA
jgi:hypothetical protein